jgi:hypothetical protein
MSGFEPARNLLHSLRKGRHYLDALLCIRSVVALNPALPFWKMLDFVFLPAILETSHCLVFVPLINTVLLLGAPMQPTWWVKFSIYFQSKRFLSITFILIYLKLLIIFVHNSNVLCYVVHSYHVLVTSLHLCLYVYSSALMCFSSNACL